MNWEDVHSLTPLILAAGQDGRDKAAIYLTNGADVNKPNRKGETPLSVATKYNRTEMAELLRAHGAE